MLLNQETSLVIFCCGRLVDEVGGLSRCLELNSSGRIVVKFHNLLEGLGDSYCSMLIAKTFFPFSHRFSKARSLGTGFKSTMLYIGREME